MYKNNTQPEVLYILIVLPIHFDLKKSLLDIY